MTTLTSQQNGVQPTSRQCCYGSHRHESPEKIQVHLMVFTKPRPLLLDKPNRGGSNRLFPLIHGKPIYEDNHNMYLHIFQHQPFQQGIRHQYLSQLFHSYVEAPTY